MGQKVNSKLINTIMSFLRTVESAFGMDPNQRPLSQSTEESGLGEALDSVASDLVGVAPAAITLGLVAYGVEYMTRGLRGNK